MKLIALAVVVLFTACRREVPHGFAGSWLSLPVELHGEAQGMAPHWSVVGKGGAVSSANALASEAGASILRRGGNALDALLAVQWVLSVVEPQSSGLGGGGFLLYYETKTGKVYALDGREQAPAAIRADTFLAADGKPLPFMDRLAGARAVGVPGTVALLSAAHRRFGNFAFRETFARAIELAELGFRVSPRLSQAMRINRDRLLKQNGSSVPLLRSGEAYAVGEILVQSELAATLKRLRDYGEADFYHGSIAADILATVSKNTLFASAMTADDLKNYKAIERPVEKRKTGAAELYSVSAPASGKATLAAIGATNSTKDDRALIISSLAAQRSALVEREKTLQDPGFAKSTEAQNTTHVAIADAEGNIVSYTSSVETSLGSCLFVHGRGFILNNQLSDFNPQAKQMNSAEGGKRPKSSMSPLILRQSDGSFTALGSPGGATIVGSVALTASRILAGHEIQDAINMPRAIGMPNGKVLVELPLKRDGNFLAALRRAGFDADLRRNVVSLGSVQAVSFNPRSGLFTAASDLRREGLALVVDPQVE
ncbi:MAG: gamma-glutamyltransferase [Turneriella sp.]